MDEGTSKPRIKALSLTIEGLEPFAEKLTFDHLCPYTGFVGPNGSGKTKILEAIAKIFTFLHDFDVACSHQELDAVLQLPHPAASRWKLATLTGQLDGNHELPWAGEMLNSDGFKVHIAGPSERVKLTYVEFTGVFWDMTSVDDAASYTTEQRRKKAKRELAKVTARVSQWKALVQHLNNPDPQIAQQLAAACEEESLVEQQLQSRANGAFSLDQAVPPVRVEHVRQFLEALCLPQCRMLQGSSIRGVSIPEFEKHLLDLKSKAYSESSNSAYQVALAYLSRATKMKATLDAEHLSLDGRRFPELSFGTQLKVSFLAAEQLVPKEVGLILWDEPETGLHPSWCVKVADMMRLSERRYFVGTHRTELVVAEADGRSPVFRLNGEFNFADHDSVRTTVTQVDDHLGLLEISQRLGLEPSRALFTANAIIWIEGPSDALFWRAWIRAAEAESMEKVPLLREGFDFAFCFTAGSLLSHHLPVDDYVDPKKIVQFLRVTPAALVIADSDLTAESPETIRQAIAESETLDANTADALKPRVKAIHSAIQMIGQPSRMSLMLTYGREVEDSLTDEAFRMTLESVAPNGFCNLARKTTSPRTIWEGFTGSKEKFSLNDPSVEAPGRLVRNVEKVEFAQAYVAGTPKLSDLHPNAQKRVRGPDLLCCSTLDPSWTNGPRAL